MLLVFSPPTGMSDAIITGIYLLVYFLVFLLVVTGFYIAIKKIAPAELQNLFIGVLIVIAIIILALAILAFMGGR